jgi:hypothetical protein
MATLINILVKSALQEVLAREKKKKTGRADLDWVTVRGGLFMEKTFRQSPKESVSEPG